MRILFAALYKQTLGKFLSIDLALEPLYD